ncbi:terminase small subunit [uncultured Clostridium sp.]|uniref:terminase small subunit n=1 Tax=uncultured Clostridium sp. TaxID=59620 RepID=UPI00262D7851|nr:terminase small subunit [uncultured Clostridium sp.]
MNKIGKMSEKMKLFADYYLEHLNGTKAYMDAYNCKNEITARTNAYKNLQKPIIKDYVESRLKEIESKRIASITEIMEFYTDVLRGNETDAFGLDVGIDSRLKAAEQLGKRLGMGVTSKEQEYKLKSLELEIEKKKLEIEKIKIGDDVDSNKTMEAIDKLSKKLESDFNEG